jgi:hypothetical protein
LRFFGHLRLESPESKRRTSADVLGMTRLA